MKPLIAGNWKMHGKIESVQEFTKMIEGFDAAMRARADLLVCPPTTLLLKLAEIAGASGIGVGAQDCHFAASGAHTGNISAEMIHDAGGSAVIVGHSERRTHHRESNDLVAAKAAAAQRAGLTAIVCVGETEAERRAGEADAVVSAQVRASIPADCDPSRLVVAYEPVWAIGTGLTPTPADIAAIHARIAALLVERFGAAGEGVRILYGGSVKPDNAGELLAIAHVDGALVGGASLKAVDFLAIAVAAVGKPATAVGA